MNVAFIPVRGGSKSIPLKNIRPMCGKPLVYWTVKAACQCQSIDRVYVSTDSEQIRQTVEAFGLDKVTVIGRSAETASDTASTESAMLEFARQYSFDHIALIQATSPLLRGEDLDGGFALYESPDCDSVLSVVRQYRFLWKTDEQGIASPANYDVFHRPRRQEFDGYLMENGAFYITSRQRLLDSENRVSGNIKAYEMAEETAYEIDEPSDWVVIEQLLKRQNAAEKNKPNIRMLLTDCDGCLTDGGMYYSERGDELKKFNTKDGMAFAMLRKQGIVTGIVTGESVELNRRRAEKLQLDEIHLGISDKLSVVEEIARRRGIPLEEMAYIGDDINDIPVLQAVGLSFCPKDAVPEVLNCVDHVTQAKGGQGVIREVADQLYGKS